MYASGPERHWAGNTGLMLTEITQGDPDHEGPPLLSGRARPSAAYLWIPL